MNCETRLLRIIPAGVILLCATLFSGFLFVHALFAQRLTHENGFYCHPGVLAHLAAAAPGPWLAWQQGDAEG